MKLSFKKEKFNLLIPRILDYVASFDDKNEYELEIKKKREIRSINANNYSWTLTDKLAEKLVVAGVKLSKEECHAEMIFRYGQVLLDGNGERVVYSTSQEVNMPEFFPYAKQIGESELNGKTFKHYLIYRGSRSYNSKEFSIFLSGIIEECREQGIETMTPSEIALMMENYKEVQ